MELEGASKEEEQQLLSCLKGAKWFLNENVGVPECNGMKDGEHIGCDVCSDYTCHVGEEFGSGNGSLKAARMLQKLYTVAEAQIDRADLLNAIKNWCDKVAELKVDIRIVQQSKDRALNKLCDIWKHLVKLEAAREHIALADEAQVQVDVLEDLIKQQAQHIVRLDDETLTIEHQVK
ncbi:hypothetical protein B0H17DRAFT_1204154 [Mycena rosella]|uniref:Uncharacterized protein n=1 Tax=Mycena rosella TaxID=1033263 RepID=A0AAD7GE48_MYCRO|nr:hypothetical protein B0H17DRAFT_1204154 [Mycena rosella]